MIFLICLLVPLVLGQSPEELPSRFEIETSINRTINEVEKMIREDPKLPRLTRSEIVDILYNITSNDSASLTDENTMDKARMEYQRALMIVLPYNPKDSEEDLKDLYTKPPMIKMVPDIPSTRNDIKMVVENGRKEEIVYPEDSGRTLENSVVPKHPDISKDEEDPKSERLYKNHREIYSDVVDAINFEKQQEEEEKVLQGSPEKFSFNLENLGAEASKETTRKSMVKNDIEDSTAVDSKLEIVYSTSAVRKPAMKSTTEILHKEPPKPTTPSSKTTQHILSSDQWLYNAPPHSMETHGDDEKGDGSQIAKPEGSPVYVVPTSGSTPKSKYSSSYTAASGGFLRITTPLPMRSEVQDLLASIGLYPGSPEGTNDQIPVSNNAIYPQASALDTGGIESSSILSQNTFGSGGFDLKNGVNNLTPDMQLLFQKFGLQTSKHVVEATTRSPTTTTTVDLNPYTNFKPLPTAEVENKDLRDFLAKFGLGNDARKQKSAKTGERSAVRPPPSLVEAVPDDMRAILENVGLISRAKKSMIETASKDEETTTKLHIFKPHEVPLHTDEQKEKINKLLDTVRMVQNGGASSQDVQKAANELLQTSKTLTNGPDPLSLEEILNIYNEGMKNEVKRQEGGAAAAEEGETTTTTTTTTTSTTTTTETTTTTTAAASNIDALVESFGGSTKAPDPVLPTRRRSGLYFLVDWNTFLEVGEEGKDKVNLRFQPKVGDRTRFIPVTVP